MWYYQNFHENSLENTTSSSFSIILSVINQLGTYFNDGRQASTVIF